MSASPPNGPTRPTDIPARGSARRSLILGGIFILLLAACWSGGLERIARGEAEAALGRVLVAFALARTLNGAISVAQGTEIALQPAGVGVTLTAGEVLDPLNDLVERFSILALTASISLQGQLLLAELLSTAWVNLLLTGCVAIYLLTALIPKLRSYEKVAARITSLVMFTRLIFVVVMFTANWLGNLTLADRQTAAVADLAQTRDQISEINQEAELPPSTDPSSAKGSLFDRVSEFFAEQRSALDMSGKLQAVVDRSEAAVSDLISLSTLFLLQYVALPIGAFWLASFCVRTAWSIWWQTPPP